MSSVIKDMSFSSASDLVWMAINTKLDEMSLSGGRSISITPGELIAYGTPLALITYLACKVLGLGTLTTVIALALPVYTVVVGIASTVILSVVYAKIFHEAKAAQS
jgi:hypothetical protein